MTISIDDAVSQLQRHKGLSRVGTPVQVGDYVHIEIDVPVALPSRAQAKGVSRTGVRALETCTLIFGSGWPLVAPRPRLRTDFPLNLPHINPHRSGELVRPCIFEGSLNELLHRFGLDAIVDQLIDWLNHAAADTLIDLSHGWEPTRRDSNPSTIVFSAEKLVAAAAQDGSINSLISGYATVGKGIYAVVEKSMNVAPDLRFRQTIKTGSSDKWGHGITVTLVAQAPFIDGQAQVFSAYTPETVFDVQSLLARASSLGIDANALEAALSDFYNRSVIQTEENPHDWVFGMWVLVILLAQRPAPLVGSPERSTEVLPYVIRYDIDPKAVFEKKASVHTAYHAHALSPELLARTSGVPIEAISNEVVMVGCGSLGSKIAMHLGRAGFGRITFVDNESMSPHNAARHAVSEQANGASPPLKAQLMLDALSGLEQTTARAFSVDAVTMFGGQEQFSAIVPPAAKLIIDTTASLQLMAAETLSVPLDTSPARLARAMMYGQGRSTLLLLEGIDRSVRVDDLTAFSFECCRSDERLRTSIAGTTAEPMRIFVGDNCRSLTMPMSDAVVSRSASLLGMQLEQWLIDGIPKQAMMCAGSVGQDGIGMGWATRSLGPTTILHVKDDGGWSVRLLEPVVQAIGADAAQWGERETGGALVGRISFETRTITIAGLVDAPADSIREIAKFVLGTEGLVHALRLANANSLGHLQFIGTWHTHPQGGKHSRLDRATLRRIAEDAGGQPTVSLVWTPSGFSCIVGRW